MSLKILNILLLTMCLVDLPVKPPMVNFRASNQANQIRETLYVESTRNLAVNGQDLLQIFLEEMQHFPKQPFTIARPAKPIICSIELNVPQCFTSVFPPELPAL